MENKMNCRISESSSDDDTESSEDEQDFSKMKNRVKRDIEWCGTDTRDNVSYQPRRVVIWPPPSTSSSSRPSQITLRNVHLGNPKLGSKMQLYSKTGQHIAVYPDGKVRGTIDENDLHTYLELTSAEYPGQVKIQGLLTKLYIAMDRRGRLYGEVDPTEESAVFIESFQGLYNTYLSRKYAHLGWYIGLKKSGKFKRGPKTRYRQKAVKFLPRRQRFE